MGPIKIPHACYNCQLEYVCRSMEKFDEFRDYFNNFNHGGNYSLNECLVAIASLCDYYKEVEIKR